MGTRVQIRGKSDGVAFHDLYQRWGCFRSLRSRNHSVRPPSQSFGEDAPASIFDKNHLFRIVCNGWECDDWTSEKCQIMSRVLVLKYSAWSSHAFIQYYHAVPSHNKTEMTHLSRGQKSRWCMMQTRCAGDQNDLKTKRETRSLCLSTVLTSICYRANFLIRSDKRNQN